METPCLVCGKPVGPDGEKFCSIQCNAISQRKRDYGAPCTRCGKPRGVNRSYCGQECLLASVAKFIPCAGCKEPVPKAKDRKFCTDECRVKHRVVKVKKPRPTIADRFWAKVQKSDGCWLWTGRRQGPSGSTAFPDVGDYGTLKINGSWVRAHRISWEIHHGPIPDGTFVCHTCDTPPCVRPEHLWLGDAKANAEDMVAKGRNRVAHPGRSGK